MLCISGLYNSAAVFVAVLHRLYMYFFAWAETFLTLWTCCNLGAMATKVRRHDSRVHPYQRIVTTDRG